MCVKHLDSSQIWLQQRTGKTPNLVSNILKEIELQDYLCYRVLVRRAHGRCESVTRPELQRPP